MRRTAARALAVPLLAAAAAALPAAPARAASWPGWATPPEADPFLERNADEDAIVLLDDWDITVRGGRRNGTRRRVVRVLTEEGRSHAALTLARGAFDRFSRVKVWVRDTSGRVSFFGEDEGSLFAYSDRKILDDVEVLVLTPRAVQPGGLVAVEYRFRHEPDILQDILPIQGPVPVLRATVSVEAAGGWSVVAKVAGGTNPGPAEATKQGSWSFRELPGRASGKQSFSPEPPLIRIGLNYVPPGGPPPFLDWNSVARWGAALFELPGASGATAAAGPVAAPSPPSAPPAASAGDPVEAAGLAARTLRYFAIELGWGGYRPRPPETTLSRAFGDCKDKALLMVRDLRRAGIPAVPVLAIAPPDGYVHDELPGPRQFNHAIVGVPWTGTDRLPGLTVVEAPGIGPLRLFDATLSPASPQDISVMLEGGAALALDARTTGLMRIPGSGPGDNIVETTAEWTLRPDGSVRVRMTERIEGAVRTLLEGEGGEPIAPKKLRERVVDEVARHCVQFEDLEVGPIERDASGHWSYTVSFACPDALAAYGATRLLDLPSFQVLDLFPVPSEKKPQSLYQPLLATFRERHEIRFPGRRLVAAPPASDDANSLGRVALALVREEGKVRIDREIALLSLEIPVEKREESRRLRRALQRINSLTLGFEDDEGAAPPGGADGS